jgi:hypothetical protein
MHRGLFPCPLEFAPPETALAVARVELDSHVRAAKRKVRELLGTPLKKALRQQAEERYYSIKVLQLKLKEEGTTFGGGGRHRRSSWVR